MPAPFTISCRCSLFLISTLLFILLGAFWFLLDGEATSPGPGAPQGVGIRADGLLVVGSVITSLTTLVGFVLTSVIGWRKERREHESAQIELQKAKLEVEKLRLEVEQQRARTSPERRCLEPGADRYRKAS